MSRRNAPSTDPVNSRLGLVLDAGWRNAAPTEMKRQREDEYERPSTNFLKALDNLGETIDTTKSMPVLITLPMVLKDKAYTYEILKDEMESANFQTFIRFSDKPNQPKCSVAMYVWGWKTVAVSRLGPDSIMEEDSLKNIVHIFGPAVIGGKNSTLSDDKLKNMMARQADYGEMIVDAITGYAEEKMDDYYEALGYS